MKARRLEEVLEECISAYRQGRRSIDESLSLYPDLADRLAPLLRTAATISHNLDATSPPLYFQEHVRQRLLLAATDRVRARAITRWLEDRRCWSRRQWLALGAAMALALGLLVVLTGVLLSSAGSSEDLARDQSPPTIRATPVAVSLRLHVDSLWLGARLGTPVALADVVKLRELASRIQDPVQMDTATRPEVATDLTPAIQDGLVLLQTVATDPSSDVPPAEAQGAIEEAREVAEEWGIRVAGLPAPPEATAAGEPQQLESGQTAGTTATPSPADAPTAAPSTPAPTIISSTPDLEP